MLEEFTYQMNKRDVELLNNAKTFMSSYKTFFETGYNMFKELENSLLLENPENFLKNASILNVRINPSQKPVVEEIFSTSVAVPIPQARAEKLKKQLAEERERRPTFVVSNYKMNTKIFGESLEKVIFCFKISFFQEFGKFLFLCSKFWITAGDGQAKN